MMFDSQTQLAQPGAGSPFAQQGLFGGLAGQYGQVPGVYGLVIGQAIGHAIGQAIATCLNPQLGLPPTALAQHGVFGNPQGLFGQSMGGWHAQPQFGGFGGFGPQVPFGGLYQAHGPFAGLGIGSWLGQQQIPGLSPQSLFGGLGGPYGQPAIGGWPGQTQFAGQLTGLTARGFLPYQLMQQPPLYAQQPAYAG